MQAIAASVARAVFRQVHGNNLVYNTCWEDPRVDIPALALDAESDVLVLTSAGCNALDYALEAPRHVYAVDLNYRQNALLELKQAAIKALDYDAFFALFGDGGHADFPEWYAQLLRPRLSAAARKFWDRRGRLLSRPTPESSFYRHGTTGTFGRLMVGYFKAAGVHDAAVALFAADTLDAQRSIYFDRIRPALWKPWLKRLLEGDAVLSLLGVPRAQREHIERTTGRGVADFVERVVESVFTDVPTTDNHFWRLYLFGRYTRECCPRYLQPTHFERLKSGLVDRVSTHTSDVTHFLQGHPRSLSHFVLLDHMDWLASEQPDALQAEWQAIVDRARDGARLLWRSGGVVVDFVDPLRVTVRGRERRVGELLSYEHELASRLAVRDRVRTYGSFYIADLHR